MTFRRPTLIWCLLLPALIFLAVPAMRAQTPQAPQGPIVKDIVVENVGAPSISKERVLANLATKVGQPYTERAAEQDIRALYATGGVSNVRLFAEPLGDGVKVTVLLQGRPVIEEVIIEGADRVPLNRVRREISTKVGDVVSEEKIESDRQKIIKLYEDRNFSEVDITYRIQEVTGKNRSRVTFSITEGPKLVVKKITFVGNDSILPRDLRKVMKTKPEDMLSFLTKSGRLLSSQVEDDRVAIRTLYQNRGFADVDVSDIQTQPVGNDGVELIVTIVEGLQYRVNSIKVDGANVVPQDQLLGRMKMLGGQLFTPKGMGDDLKALRDFYGSRGYVDMVALPEVLPAGPGAVDLTYRLNEGVQSYVNLINIQGNTRTQDRVIRRELAVKPGDVFDTTLVDVSKKRLENLNYFSRVETPATDTIVPGRKDLNVIVEEKRTGSFNFGVGFSTIDSLLGFAELQQSNFDILNWPNFTGGGQRFRIRGQYGLQRSDFVISLTEPWFLGYKLSVGVEGYYRNANFLSAVYQQENYGVAFQARKQLWRALSARGEYRIENIRIYNVDNVNNNNYFFFNGYGDGYNGNENAGPVIENSAGTYTKSAFTGSLTWDTRDSLFLTRKGELIELTGFIAGGPLGGTVQDYGLSLEFAKYFSLPLDLIFLVKGQIAITNGWGGNTASVDGGYGNGVPIFDRLYLGGANNMRGFNFREVGPVDQYGNPIGGNSLAYITFEMTFPIVPRVRGAFFTDMGFVNVSPGDFSTSNANVDAGFGLRLDLPIGPIRVDYGIPLVYDSWNGPPGKFNFNIGYQF
ncbi:MAG: outer membrane protein assembly factor BamA [Verrucomicrobiaceae bacterium]|nr:MAG: outer membrane protein assembly factor BamA [Verrucomicrobiaceae bacterium]